MGSDNLFNKRKAHKGAKLKRENYKRVQNQRYLIVCEGTKTEPQYLHDLIEDLHIGPLIVRIAQNDGLSPDKVVAHALALYEDDAKRGDAYDTVYCVFDRDSHTTFDDAVQRTKDLSNAGKPLVAIASTPCFEIWLLLHFGYTDQPFYAAGKKSVGDQVEATLKTKPGFKKYEKGQNGIYNILKDTLDDALIHAEQLRNHCKKTASNNPATDIDQLVLDLQKLRR